METSPLGIEAEQIRRALLSDVEAAACSNSPDACPSPERRGAGVDSAGSMPTPS